MKRNTRESAGTLIWRNKRHYTPLYYRLIHPQHSKIKLHPFKNNICKILTSSVAHYISSHVGIWQRHHVSSSARRSLDDWWRRWTPTDAERRQRRPCGSRRRCQMPDPVDTDGGGTEAHAHAPGTAAALDKRGRRRRRRRIRTCAGEWRRRDAQNRRWREIKMIYLHVYPELGARYQLLIHNSCYSSDNN